MLRHAFASPKLAALARKLGVRRYQAVGILEHLWYFTATQAPRGDIGRWTDEEIAAGIDWPADASVLVEALVSSRWLDRCGEHRLLVHDWADHCDQTVKRSPQVRNQGFCKLVASGSLASDASAARVVEQLTCAAQDSLSLSPEPEPEPVPEPDTPAAPAGCDGKTSATAQPAEDPVQGQDGPTAPPDVAPDPAPVPEAVRFAEDYRASLVARRPGFKPPTPAAFRTWCDEARLMLERDGRPLGEARELARWLFAAESDDAKFWIKNCLSVPSFRKHYERLIEGKQGESHATNDGRDRRGGGGRIGPLEAMANIRRREAAARGDAAG